MLLKKEVSKASITKIVGVSRPALYHFIATRKLDPKASKHARGFVILKGYFYSNLGVPDTVSISIGADHLATGTRSDRPPGQKVDRVPDEAD